jgi:YD repeat-containing protein
VRPPSRRCLTSLVTASLTLVIAASAIGQSKLTFQYFYDDAGQLTKVADSSGNVVGYNYDPVGNIASITRSTLSSPGALALFNFTPQRGGAGTAVTIQGQGFSGTPSSDVVQFNGTPALVTSATSSTLTVTVSAGVTTGPISVTVAGQTATSSTNFIVLPVPVITPADPTIALGFSQQMTARVTLPNGTTQDVTNSVTWTSSNTAVTTISNLTGSQGLVTSVAAGTTVITASTGSFVGSTTLTVTPPVLVSIAVSPANSSVLVGAGIQFVATGTFSDRTSQDMTRVVTWNSSDNTVATISNSAGSEGLATGIKPGTTTVSATSGAVSGSTPLTVLAVNNAGLSGNYAFLFNGFDSNGLVVAAGSLVADGNGNITNGIVDVNNTQILQTGTLTGTYSIGSNNLGTMTLTFSASLMGRSQTFALAVQANGEAKFIEFDDTTGTRARGSGVLKKQDTTAFSTAKIIGNYAFGAVGVNDTMGHRLAVVGSFHADGAGIFSNGIEDVNNNGAVQSSQTFTGTYSVASTGRGTAALNITGVGTINFAFYIVSAAEALLIETDSVTARRPLVAGTLLQQTGAFTAGSLSGTSVFETSGLNGVTTPTSSAGLAITDGVSTLTFTSDQNSGGTITTQSGTLTYAVTPNGRVTLTGGTGTQPVLYLVSQNKGFIIGTNVGVEFGFFENQALGPFSNSSLSGTYAGGSVTPVDSNVGDEVHVLVASSGTITGTSDLSKPSGLTQNQAFTFTYSVATNGRTVLTQIGGTDTVILYLVSPTKFVAVGGGTNPNVLIFEH